MDATIIQWVNIAGIVFIALIRFMNNLLRAGHTNLGRITFLAFLERAKDANPKLWSYLDQPIRLTYATQAFDKLSVTLIIVLLYWAVPEPNITHVLMFFGYIVIFDLWAPNAIASFIPEALIEKLFPVLQFTYLLLFPLTGPMLQISMRGQATEEGEEVPEDVRAFLRAGTEEGIIEEKEKPLLHNLLNFNDTVVREVMTPRTDMVCLGDDMSVEAIREIFAESKFSRLPIYQGDIDDIIGFLHFKDFYDLKEQDSFHIKDIIKSMPVVPEKKPISDLLQEMLTSRCQMVLVIDEFGGTAGLTTLEDLIEEIVGEIHDEHEDVEEDEVIKLDDGTYLVDGKVLLDDFCSLFAIDIVEEDVDTVGGFIFNREGHIPPEGSMLEIDVLKVEIIKSDERRIYQIKVVPTSSSNINDAA